MNLLSEGKFVATTSKCAHCGTLFSLPLPTSSRRVILQLLLHHNDKLCTLSFAIYPARKKKKKNLFSSYKSNNSWCPREICTHTCNPPKVLMHVFCFHKNNCFYIATVLFVVPPGEVDLIINVNVGAYVSV